MTCHLMGCIWIFVADLSGGYDELDSGEIVQNLNWIDKGGYHELTMPQLYVVSIYYTVTTITTVGYGDISGTNMMEQVICIFLMVSGVFFFSFASGSLSSVITQREIENLKH